jgi:hypothetical protein
MQVSHGRNQNATCKTGSLSLNARRHLHHRFASEHQGNANKSSLSTTTTSLLLITNNLGVVAYNRIISDTARHPAY